MTGRHTFESETEMHLFQLLLLCDQAAVHLRRTPRSSRRPVNMPCFPERAGHHLFQDRLIEVSGDCDYDLHRIVMGVDIPRQIPASKIPDRFLPTQYRSAERMTPKDLSGMQLLHEIFRIVLDHPDFFEHDLLFLLDFSGIET